MADRRSPAADAIQIPFRETHHVSGRAVALAEALVAACEGESQFKFLYDANLPIEEKIAIISKEIYGADGIELSDLAKQQVETYTRQGYGNLPSPFSHL